MHPRNYFGRAALALSLALPLLTESGRAQPVVVNAGASHTFYAQSAATNFSWTLDGTNVGGNSNAFTYAPQWQDAGTHYLVAGQTLPGGVSTNAYWEVRADISLPASGAYYYVATNGSDTNSGSIAAPFLTLEAARDAIRSLAGHLPAGGVTVYLLGGTYYRTNTFVLTSGDSGTATAPVVYRGYPGQNAVISGGKPIPAASWHQLDNSQTNRVAPGINPTNIWELNIASAGILHATNFPGDFNQWTTYNIYDPGSSGGLCELMYNDQRQFLSRYPNHSLVNDDLLTTNMLMDGVAQGSVPANELIYADDSTNYLNYPGTYTNSAGQAIAVGGAFYCQPGDVARFTRWQSAITNGGLWLQGYWRVGWQIDGVKILGFDATNRAVLLDPSAHPANGLGNKYNRPAGSLTERFWALNLLEEMDQPGEWAVDFSQKMIYFYAPGPLTNGSVVISDFGSPLAQIVGGSNLVFESLTFENGLAQGIQITNGLQNLMAGCTFRNLGNYPADIAYGGTNGVVSCNLEDLAAGGVLLRGGNETSTPRVPANDFVVNNVITNFGRVVRVYAAAVDAGFGGAGGSGGGGGHTECVGMRVAHNTMSVSPHCVVLHGSWDSTFEYNNLGYYQQVSDDLGGFYSDDLISRHGDQTFRYNFFHDTPLGNGIDFDGDYFLMNIYGNVMNLNTIPSESQGIGVRYQDADQATSGDQQSVNCHNNLVANTHLGASFVALLPSVIQANAAIDCSASFTWNQVVVGATNNTIAGSSQAAMQSGPNMNYTSDPGFLSLTNNDLRLSPFSRVYSDLPNFQQIPVEMIGLYNDEFRTNIGWSPFVTTDNAVNITPTNAVCAGTLYFPQFDSNTTVIVYYGLTDGGSNAPAWQSATNLGVFPAGNLSATVNGLLPGTNYYFRFFATNAFGFSWSPASSPLVTPPPPPFTAFVNLPPNQTVLANALVSLSGQVFNTAPLYPGNGESVSITIDGVTQTTYTTNNNGSFALVFNTTNLPEATGAYAITYAYGGDANLAGATNTATALSIVPATVNWSGAADTNFENGGTGGNWSDYAAPINDLVSSTAIFGDPPVSNQPSLTLSRNLFGLSFGAADGGWTLGGGSPNDWLGLGAGGVNSPGQTGGTNVINAGLIIAANQTWRAGTGGSLLMTGSITNENPATNYSLTIGAGGLLGNVILSPAAGNQITLVGSNNTASIFQVKTGGTLMLGGDGVNAPATTSTNHIQNTAVNAFLTWGVNAPGTLQVNSGTWLTGDLGKNGGDQFTGTLDVNGGVINFAGARYLGAGTINVNNGTLKVTCVGSSTSNGGRFSLGALTGGSPNAGALNLTGGFVDLAQANGGNSLGAGTSSQLNQSGGVLQNGVTVGGGVNGGTVTTFTLGGTGTGTTNNLTAFTLAGGTFLSAGTVLAAGAAGPGSVNNFNLMGGVLAVAGFNAANLGSSPGATATANQTSASLAIGTLANYGATLAPGGWGIPGETVITGNYAVSNTLAALAIDLGGTNPATAFQNGPTNYDVVSVTGSATLGGSLLSNLLNGFSPAATDSFTILTTGGSLGGGFTNVVNGRVAVTNVAGGSFELLLGANSVALTNYLVLEANFSASTNGGAAPLMVTFTDVSTGAITNRQWNFGDGTGTNTLATALTHTFTAAGTNQVVLVVGDGLALSTNTLAVVVRGPVTSPVIGRVGWSGTNLVLAGTNAGASGEYFVLGATNLLTPATNWTVLATNAFEPGGGFHFTNPAAPGSPESFYRLKVP